MGAVILGAGKGERLGTVAKALIKTSRGLSLLETIVQKGRTLGVECFVIVVADPHKALVIPEAERLGIPWVENPAPHLGMASSVEIAFTHAQQAWHTEGALLWPVDHAAISLKSLSAIAEHVAADKIVVPSFQGRGGHPTFFGRKFWPSLMRCQENPEGAKTLVKNNVESQRRIALHDPGVVHDIDTLEDLHAI